MQGMKTSAGRFRWIAVLAALAWFPLALAGKALAPQGLVKTLTVEPETGFIDDVIALDDAGRRIAVVRTDGATFAEIEVRSLEDSTAPVLKVNVGDFTLEPTALHFPRAGDGLFLVGKRKKGDKAQAAFLDAAGKTVRKWGPATSVALAHADGYEVVSVVDEARSGKGRSYRVAYYRLDTGERLAQRTLIADERGYVKKQNFTIQSWRDGMTRVLATRPGVYDEALDQRLGDMELVYDLVGDRVISEKRPDDLVAHAHLAELRQAHGGASLFLSVPEDRKGVLAVSDDGKRPLTLAESFSHYEPKSLQTQVSPDKVYFTLAIDPVHPQAVARKKADDEYVDLYEMTASFQPRRVGRLPRVHPDLGDRPYRWVAAGSTWAVLWKHKGFGRGGSRVDVYRTK